ncbi:hypothetical protein [Streptomyces alanosinicus]|uniref:Uncharacterized protein n=1 Tax=Streptomyces alanosinicus TaxID=68171 RepID=A0A918YM24_9ACTN|nr:hypothetical protein [Streptomyces alanosinicus]GHE08742.1 hypothetical protein GCM10010339_58700 [Streptomyces alanosinicus]
MARPPQPRRITLGGREAVALTLQEYEQLIASRRQIGGQSARVRVLAQQAKRTERLLRDLEALIATEKDSCRAHRHPHLSMTANPDGAAVECDTREADADTGCLRCALAALLHRHQTHQQTPGKPLRQRYWP